METPDLKQSLVYKRSSSDVCGRLGIHLTAGRSSCQTDETGGTCTQYAIVADEAMYIIEPHNGRHLY